MSMMPGNLIIDIVTEKNETEFQLRFFDDGKAGILHTRTGESYFVLDSSDYWYDLIQSRYPPVKKCSCENDWFKVRFEYIIREGYDEFRSVFIDIYCTKCNQEELVVIDFRHSPTMQLYETPITFCEKPVIKYSLHLLAGYWTTRSLKKIIKHMCCSLDLKAYCWFMDLKERKKYFKLTDYKELRAIVGSSRFSYTAIFFARTEMALNEMIEEIDTGDTQKDCINEVYVKEDIWRTHELIKLGGPIVIASDLAWFGLREYYMVSFCEQFICDGAVVEKSEEFKELTSNVLKWMNSNFSTARGANCYDSKLL